MSAQFDPSSPTIPGKPKVSQATGEITGKRAAALKNRAHFAAIFPLPMGPVLVQQARNWRPTRVEGGRAECARRSTSRGGELQ